MKEKKNIIEIIGSSFKKWWNNFIIVLPFVFSMIASVIAVLLLFLIFSLIFGAIFGSTSLEALKDIFLKVGQFQGAVQDTTFNKIAEALSSLLSPAVFIYIVIAIIVSVLIVELIKAYFFAGAIVMASDIVTDKKTNLKAMSAGSRFFWRYWFVKIVITIGVILWLFIFSLPFIFTKNINLLLVPVLSIIPLVFVYLLFALAEYFVVLEDLDAWKAIKRSIEVVKANYWAMFGLGLLLLLISAAANFIPWIGGIVNLIVVVPVQTIAFVIFAIERGH